MINLEGKIAIVTGGASGIGRQISLLLSQLGTSVAVADLNKSLAEQTALEIAADHLITVTEKQSLVGGNPEVLTRLFKLVRVTAAGRLGDAFLPFFERHVVLEILRIGGRQA